MFLSRKEEKKSLTEIMSSVRDLRLLSCYVCIEVLVVRDGIEAGTGLGAVPEQIAVSDDLGIRVFAAQVTKESVHGHELFGSTGIFGSAIFGNSALVAHADALRVESLDMSADLVFRSTCVQLTILSDVVVIADVVPAIMHNVTFTQFFDRKVLRQLGRRTMYHDPLDITHRHSLLHRGLSGWQSILW